MGYKIATHICIIILGVIMLLVPEFCAYEFTPSRAAYSGSPDYYGTLRGACGYGEFGRIVNDGQVSAVSRLYRNGVGCGACYQVRCTNPHLCNNDGVNVVVTDHGEGDHTDFILSPRAFSKLALANVESELFAHGVVDVEYKRVSCQYPGYNVMYKVHEHSKFPHYVALTIVYVAGQNDITCVELWQEDCKQWIPMRNAYGAVWDRANPPEGSLTLRFQVSGSDGNTFWVQSTNAIPEDWKAGSAYDAKAQLQ